MHCLAQRNIDPERPSGRHCHRLLTRSPTAKLGTTDIKAAKDQGCLTAQPIRTRSLRDMHQYQTPRLLTVEELTRVIVQRAALSSPSGFLFIAIQYDHDSHEENIEIRSRFIKWQL